VIRPEPAEHDLDRESKRYRREGNPVTDEDLQITTHADVAGYRHLPLEQAR